MHQNTWITCILLELWKQVGTANLVLLEADPRIEIRKPQTIAGDTVSRQVLDRLYSDSLLDAAMYLAQG